MMEASKQQSLNWLLKKAIAWEGRARVMNTLILMIAGSLYFFISSINIWICIYALIVNN